MERPRYTAVIRFESTSHAEYEQFLKDIAESGGVLVDGLVTIEDVPDTYIMDRATFAQNAEDRGLNAAWTTRYWGSLVDMHADEAFPGLRHDERPALLSVDLRLVRSRLAETEQGHRDVPYGIGQRSWNMLAEIINERATQDPNIFPLLPWDEEVHPYLRRLTPGNVVVDTLTDRYNTFLIDYDAQ